MRNLVRDSLAELVTIGWLDLPAYKITRWGRAMLRAYKPRVFRSKVSETAGIRRRPASKAGLSYEPKKGIWRGDITIKGRRHQKGSKQRWFVAAWLASKQTLRVVLDKN